MKSNSLTKKFPHLAKEWHPSKNGSLLPGDIACGSNKKVWWKCDKGSDHEWEMSPNKRTSRGDGCTICSNRKIVFSNCLLTLRPDLASEWDFDKNKKLTPKDVGVGSNLNVYWSCSKNSSHKWQTKIISRTINGTGCPICSNNNRGLRRRTSKFEKSLANLYPQIAKKWDKEKNKFIIPENVYPTSSAKYFWLCDNDEHPSYLMGVAERVKSKYGCPICAKKGALENKLKAKPGRSLGDLFPNLVNEWDSQRNFPTTPFDINPFTHRKFWWQCLLNKNHFYEASASNRSNIGSGCPYCRGLKVNQSNSLLTLAPHIAREWHPKKNGNLFPENVTLKSHKKIWWICSRNKNHIWKAAISNRQNTGCPFCVGQQVLKEDSFGKNYPKLMREWDYEKNTNLDPLKLTPTSGKDAWWICTKDKEHKWKIRIIHRVQSKTGCPFCTLTPQSKQELQITFELKSIFKTLNPTGHKIKIGTKLFSIDIFIRELNLCLEFDGSYWHRNKEHVDVNKTKILIDNGYNVIRIREFPLKQIFPNDIISSQPFNAKVITNEILNQIINEYQMERSTLNKIDKYLKFDTLQNTKGLDKYIDNLLKTKAESKKMKK